MVLPLRGTESARAQSAGTPAFTCGAAQWSAQSTAAGSFAVSADFIGNRPTPTFTNGAPFTMELHVAAPSADVLEWRVSDYDGGVVASGDSAIKGTGTLSVSCVSTRAGYFSLGASFQAALRGLPRVGSRPAGIATFGILPNTAPWLPAAPSGPLDTHRFGLQGANFVRSGICCEGDGLQPINQDVGSTWVLDSRSELNMEPTRDGQYNPSTQPLDVGFESGRLARIVTLNGIPAWASTAPAGATGSYPPKSFAAFGAYTALVGEESARVQATYIPNQEHNYYQVTWEPDPGTPTAWKGSDAQFVQLYQAAWDGVHATDSNAQVMGPATTSIPLCDAWLNRLAPLGLTRYLDAVSCHGYYAIAASSAIPPETAGLAGQMRSLRHTMANVLPAGTKLFITETGIAYPMGSTYSASYPTSDVLAQHAQAIVRTHLMLLGEGADTSFLFYSADYSGQVGYGLYFNLDMPVPDFGSPNISPKPAAMAVAAAAALVDGTKSLGALTSLPSNTYGYSFLLGDGVHVVTALWTHDSTFEARAHYALTVDAPGTGGTVVLFDAMGNPWPQQYANGALTLALTEMPTYVLSSNVAVMKRQVLAPEGYE